MDTWDTWSSNTPGCDLQSRCCRILATTLRACVHIVILCDAAVTETPLTDCTQMRLKTQHPLPDILWDRHCQQQTSPSNLAAMICCTVSKITCWVVLHLINSNAHYPGKDCPCCRCLQHIMANIISHDSASVHMDNMIGSTHPLLCHIEVVEGFKLGQYITCHSGKKGPGILIH